MIQFKENPNLFHFIMSTMHTLIPIVMNTLFSRTTHGRTKRQWRLPWKMKRHFCIWEKITIMSSLSYSPWVKYLLFFI